MNEQKDRLLTTLKLSKASRAWKDPYCNVFCRIESVRPSHLVVELCNS